ncbi:Protein yippee-like [Dichanthelium oligosanthes]|uniref:Protein yippee-like n=1 Tax=Dichanthelium oligosanthes TaxID=888268 RepID=A0A1E5VKK6_9POAL|nr:Protein yippee-like [Dichanthelium oligosanthes]
MGRLLLVSLPPATDGGVIYRCKHCGTHLAYATDIISRTFRCKNGKAYLLEKMVNVNAAAGERDDRMMTTGLHTVCDILCVACGSVLGWKYLAAFNKTQRYKEGKFIMDRTKVLSGNLGGPLVVGQQQQQQQSHSHSSGGGDGDEQTSDSDDEEDDDSSSDHQDIAAMSL